MDIAAALIAGIIGGLVGYLAQVFLSVRTAEASILTDQIEELKRIEAYTVQYWLGEYQDQDVAKALEAKIKGAVIASSSFESVGPAILGCRFEKYADLISELDEVATGGTFENDERMVDPSRAVAAMRLVGELITHLRNCRKYTFLWR